MSFLQSPLQATFNSGRLDILETYYIVNTVNDEITLGSATSTVKIPGSITATNTNNLYLGLNAGGSNTTGDHITCIGKDADVEESNGTYRTAVGAGAIATENNQIMLGRATDYVRVPNLLDTENGIRFGGIGGDIMSTSPYVPRQEFAWHSITNNAGFDRTLSEGLLNSASPPHFRILFSDKVSGTVPVIGTDLIWDITAHHMNHNHSNGYSIEFLSSTVFHFRTGTHHICAVYRKTAAGYVSYTSGSIKIVVY